MRNQHGYPGHFIAASSCLFHLHTTAGSFRISTVGDYHPQHARGPGDALGERQDEPASWSEIDSLGYADADAAEAGHELLCAKYERLMLDVRGIERIEGIDHVLAQLQTPALRDSYARLVAHLEYRRELLEDATP